MTFHTTTLRALRRPALMLVPLAVLASLALPANAQNTHRGNLVRAQLQGFTAADSAWLCGSGFCGRGMSLPSPLVAHPTNTRS